MNSPGNHGLLWALLVACPMLSLGCDRSTTEAKAPVTRAVGETRTPVSAHAGTSPTRQDADSPLPPDEQCADCHPEQAEAFAATGMGRSFYLPKTAKVIEDFSKAVVQHPRMAGKYRAYVDEAGDWWQEEVVPSTDYRRAVKVAYIIGSGNHSRSYLGLVNGELIQLPLTWYTQKGLWDMSPGYEGAGHLRFLRTVIPECLFCHNGLTPHVAGTEAQYTQPMALGINCSRCHGDGAEHVARRMAGETVQAGAADPWILNPKTLPDERAVHICQQCHLQGSTRLLQTGKRWDQYDPRTPLPDYLTVYGKRSTLGTFEIASHSQRLSQSKCRTSSDAPLRCTSCHNPHGKTTTDVRVVCASCHQPDACKDPIGRETGADCVSCHMSKGEVQDVPHVTFTDHRIHRRPKRRAPKLKLPRSTDWSSGRIVALSPPKSPDPAKDVREAHAEVLNALVGGGDRLRLPEASARLTKILERHPDQLAAFETLGKAKLELRQLSGALAAYAHLDDRAYTGVLYREYYAQSLLDAGQPGRAVAVLNVALERHPGYGIAWGLLGVAHSALGQHREATKALSRAASLMPEDSTVQFSLGMNALAEGDPIAAYAHWQKARALDPLNGLASVEMARYLRFNGRLEQAKALLSGLKGLQPQTVQMHLELARIAVTEGRLEEAQDLYALEASLHPHNPQIYIERAQLSVRQDDTSGARSALASGRLHIPGFPHWGKVERDLFGPRAPAPDEPVKPSKRSAP